MDDVERLEQQIIILESQLSIAQNFLEIVASYPNDTDLASIGARALRQINEEGKDEPA